MVVFMASWMLLAPIFPHNANAYSFRDFINDALNIVRMFFGNNRGLTDINRQNQQQNPQQLLQQHQQIQHTRQNIHHIHGININNIDNQGAINIYSTRGY